MIFFKFIYTGAYTMYTSVKIEQIFSVTSMFTAFKQTFESNYSFAGEFHNFWELVLVLDGKLGVTAGSSVHILQKGQAILHEPMEFHSLWSEGGTNPTAVIFSFSAENVPPISSKLLHFDRLNTPADILQHMKTSFEMEYATNFLRIKEEGSISHQIAIKEFEVFLLSLLNHNVVPVSTLQTQSALNFSKAVTVLEKNLEKNLSVKDIAALCNIGEVSLKKTFAKYSGIGVMSYFTKMKITAAIQLLKGGMNVSETASALGFLNQNYFSTVFKRITGHSPSYYKQANNISPTSQKP